MKLHQIGIDLMSYKDISIKVGKIIYDTYLKNKDEY